MRHLSSVVVACAALTLSGAVGCGGRQSSTVAAPTPSLSDARYAAVGPEARTAGARTAGGPSRGSQAFGNFVRAHEPQLQFCYHEARTKSPSLTGSATVAVTLTDSGSVVDAKVVRRAWSTSGSDVVESCMLTKVRAWQFPPVDPRDDHVHSFAVIFSS
ncbi:MAG TPA: AgmX/PglI C-terminal domain-containing protein [Gemmatimonadaceae bacterium]|nr:AgmX/PglI C-terminal domain-containing protein [Gemmatimonadaceae bacterium]